MTDWKPFIGILIALAALFSVPVYAGYKDRQFLQGKLPRPVHEGWLVGLTVTVAIVAFGLLKWLQFFEWVDK